MLSIAFENPRVQKRSQTDSLKDCQSSFTLRDGLILWLFRCKINKPKPFISGVLCSHALLESALIIHCDFRSRNPNQKLRKKSCIFESMNHNKTCGTEDKWILLTNTDIWKLDNTPQCSSNVAMFCHFSSALTINESADPAAAFSLLWTVIKPFKWGWLCDHTSLVYKLMKWFCLP